MWFSDSYNMNGGFYSDKPINEKERWGYWVDFPEYVQERLDIVNSLEGNFWKRLKFLFNPKA